MKRDLMSYNVDELAELEVQAVAVLERIRLELAYRRTQPDLAKLVCGYTNDGSLLDAKTQHTFARIR